jgi:hypothetical protein
VGKRIATRERYDLIVSGKELPGGAYKDGTGLSLDECCKGCRDLALGRCVGKQQTQPERAGRGPQNHLGGTATYENRRARRRRTRLPRSR